VIHLRAAVDVGGREGRVKISKNGKSAYARYVDGDETSLLRQNKGKSRYTGHFARLAADTFMG